MIKLTEKIGYGFGDMASSMFWKLFGAYLMIFYTDVFGLPAAAVGTMFLITRIWDSVFDPIVGVAADRTQTRWGKFRPYLLWLAIPFAAIGVLTFMTPSFGQTGNLIYAYITYSLMMMVYSAIKFISICAGSIFPLLWSMYADCTDYSELKTGNRATGLIFSSSSMSQKFGWAIGTAITGWLLAFFGFQANTVQSEETISGIKMFLSFLPAVGTILSVVFIAFYPLSETKMKEITATLETKRKETNE